MRILPDCSICGEPDLRLIHNVTWTALRCINCGWSYTFMPAPPEDELFAAIAQAVQGAKARGEFPNDVH